MVGGHSLLFEAAMVRMGELLCLFNESKFGLDLSLERGPSFLGDVRFICKGKPFVATSSVYAQRIKRKPLRIVKGGQLARIDFRLVVPLAAFSHGAGCSLIADVSLLRFACPRTDSGFLWNRYISG